MKKTAQYLFFKTETTGGSPTNAARLVRLSWTITDDCGNTIKSMDKYIIPDGFTIPTDAVSRHGITTEYANYWGERLERVLHVFNKSVKAVDHVICDSRENDVDVICAEMQRMDIETPLQEKILFVNRILPQKEKQHRKIHLPIAVVSAFCLILILILYETHQKDIVSTVPQNEVDCTIPSLTISEDIPSRRSEEPTPPNVQTQKKAYTPYEQGFWDGYEEGYDDMTQGMSYGYKYECEGESNEYTEGYEKGYRTGFTEGWEDYEAFGDDDEIENRYFEDY